MEIWFITAKRTYLEKEKLKVKAPCTNHTLHESYLDLQRKNWRLKLIVWIKHCMNHTFMNNIPILERKNWTLKAHYMIKSLTCCRVLSPGNQRQIQFHHFCKELEFILYKLYYTNYTIQIWIKFICAPCMRNIGTQVHDFWEVDSCCDFLVQSWWMLKP